jgi:hypothetical protein
MIFYVMCNFLYISADDASLLWKNGLRYRVTAGSFGYALLWLDRICTAAAFGSSGIFQTNLLPFHKRGILDEPSPVRRGYQIRKMMR